MVKACVFDLDGTLADTIESIGVAANIVLERLGLRKNTLEQYRGFIGEGARMLLERSLRAGGDHELRLIDHAIREYEEVFAEYCTYHVRPYPGICELLKELKERQVKLAVLSNKPHLRTVDVVNEVFGDGYFAFVQGQAEHIKRKPDPAGALLAAKNLGVAPAECLYIGDTDTDMKTGMNAGMQTIGVTWGYRDEAVLSACRPAGIIQKPEQILDFL